MDNALDFDWRPWRPGPHDHEQVIDGILCERAARPRGGSECARPTSPLYRHVLRFGNSDLGLRGLEELMIEPRPLVDPAGPHIDELP
jgi:hypothetical protein